jgi:YVTN family beta-propeller protein/VCBS repeat-containing protein
MRYGRYVGRVGVLAVALGIGSAIAAPAGIAWASPDDSASPSPSAGTASGSAVQSPATAATGKSTTTDSVDPKPGSSTVDVVAPAVTVSSSGGAHSGTDVATDNTDPAKPKPKPKKKPTVKPNVRVADTPTASTPSTHQAHAQTATGGAASGTVAASTHSTVSVAAMPESVGEVAAAVVAAQPSGTPIHTSISALLTDVVRPLLSSFLGVLDGPVESPVAWLMLAAARRQVGTTDITTTTAQMAAAQTVAAAVTNQPPTATVTWGRPDATTGAVLGQLSTSDPEGKTVTVTLTSPPSAGTLAYNSKTGVITYTPTTAQRFLAATSSNDATIAMTLTVSDGVNKVAVPVAIPVSPSPFYSSDDLTNVSSPSAVATTSNRAYVTNRGTGTVTVFDTIDDTVVATYQAGAAPDGVAVKSDGTRLYVASSANNTVTVIDTATGNVKATLAVANPTAITINPSGSTVYVADGNTGTITKISTSTNKVSGTVKLAPGLTPSELAVSSDGKKIYVASTDAAGGGNISVFSSTGTTATSVAGTTGAPTGLALSATYPRLFASSDDGTITVVDTSTDDALTIDMGVPLSGIAISNDSSVVMVTDNTGLVAALSTTDGSVLAATAVRDDTIAPMSVRPGVVLSPDGTQLFETDYDTDTVHIVSLVPPNIPPFSSEPVSAVSNPSTGALTGDLGVVDFDGDPLTYVVNTKPTKGTLVLNTNGTYTYTPTASARHAAAVPGASVTTDSFTVTVSDGRNGTLTETVPLAIDPKNSVPTVTTTIGNPSTSTGVVTGSVKTSDGDGDKRTYTVTGEPTKGTVSITSTGSFTYTPTAQARAAATAPGATHDDKQDTFTVTVDDGHGGVVPVTVNVKIGAPNSKPAGATATITNTNPRSGVVTGTLTASDADGDTLTYTAGKTTKGTIVINSDGSFTYTPTVAARLAASAPKASTSTKSETITITVTDGFGGQTTTTLKVPITPNPTTNAAPTNAQATVGNTSIALGTVTGTVTAVDPNGDTLTYSLGSGPQFGQATVSPTGQFSYTPTVDSRYRALVTPGVDTDSFTVNISDGFGGTTTATVNVQIAPPSPSAIDQRPTTVAVTAQQMYFYSQTDTDTAMGLLKNAGINNIRILIPWAGAEPTQGSFDWSAVDRMVNSANANGIKVLAVIDSTPDWAAAPGQPPLAGAPTDLTAFGDFVSDVATRYQGEITDYEIWNEPNSDTFWSPAPDAAQYTALLKVAYTAIKAADPNALVIAGAVGAAAQSPDDPSTINPVTFVSEMYADGAAGYFDALSYHPYLYSLQFSGGEGHAGVPITQAEQIYAVMVANGDGEKKIWATEYGEPSSVVGDDTQAAYIGDFLRTWRTLDFAGPAFIQTLADYPSSDPIQSSFGLFNQDWTPKPALATVEQVIAENQAIEAAADDEVV